MPCAVLAREGTSKSFIVVMVWLMSGRKVLLFIVWRSFLIKCVALFQQVEIWDGRNSGFLCSCWKRRRRSFKFLSLLFFELVLYSGRFFHYYFHYYSCIDYLSFLYMDIFDNLVSQNIVEFYLFDEHQSYYAVIVVVSCVMKRKHS